MSIVIGIKYNNGVIVAGDKQSTKGNNARGETIKIKKQKYSNSCFGCVGYSRDTNIIVGHDEIVNYKDILDNVEIDKNYVVNNIIPNLFNLYRNNNRVTNKEGIEYLNNEFIYCTSNKLFSIDADGAVTEYNDYVASGCGEDYVGGYLNNIDLGNLTKSEAIEVVNNAIKKACKNDPYINGNIDIIDIKRTS